MDLTLVRSHRRRVQPAPPSDQAGHPAHSTSCHDRRFARRLSFCCCRNFRPSSESDWGPRHAYPTACTHSMMRRQTRPCWDCTAGMPAFVAWNSLRTGLPPRLLVRSPARCTPSNAGSSVIYASDVENVDELNASTCTPVDDMGLASSSQTPSAKRLIVGRQLLVAEFCGTACMSAGGHLAARGTGDALVQHPNQRSLQGKF